MQQGEIKHLVFHPELMSREYGTNIYIPNGETTDRMQFRTSIIYAGLFLEKYPIFHLYKHDVSINGMLLDDQSYQLAATCNKVLYPIVVICNRVGRVCFIRNDQIRERWKEARPGIEREFEGEYAERYIHRTEQSLFHPEAVTNILSRDLFFHSFFSLRYGFRERITEPVTEEWPLQPSGKKTTVKFLTEIELHESGVMVRKRGTIPGGLPEETCLVDYELNGEALIDALSLHINCGGMATKMQSYYLSEHPLAATQDEDTIRMGQEMEKEAKRLNRKPLWQQFKDYLNEPL